MPETIGLLILSTLGATEIAGFAITAATASLVGNAAIVGSLLAASYLTRPDAPKPSDGQVTTRQPIPPRRRNYGRVKVGGALMFSETTNGVLYEVIAINQGEIDAFEEHWIGDIQVALAPDGSATPVAAGNSAFVNKGRKYLQIFMERGTDDDLGFPYLDTIFPGKWTAAHRGRGVAKVLLISAQCDSRDYTQVFPSGRPVYRAVIRASKVWDPRVGGQSKDVPSTWAWSENPVLQTLDYHRHKDGMGLAAQDATLFTTAAIDEDWIPSADICDEAIPLKSGETEPRYRCAGGYPLPSLPKDVLPQMFNTCQGQVFMRPDGAIGMRVGKSVTPSLIYDADEKHISNYSGFRKGDDLFLACNQVTAQFTGPDYDYQSTDVTPWRNEVDITARGQELTQSIDLSWVPSYPQARRLMKIEYYRKSPEWVGQFNSDLYALNGFGSRYLRLTLSDLEIENLDCEITAFGIDPSAGTCPIGISSFNAIAYDWDPASEEGDPPPIPDSVISSTEITPPANLAASLAARTISAGTNGAVIVMSWDAPTRPDLTAEAQYKLHSATDWLPASVSTSGIAAETPILQDGETYDVQVRFITGTRRSDWSVISSMLVGVPADPPTGFAVALDGTDPTKVNLTWTNPNSPNLSGIRLFHGAGSFGTATDDGLVASTPGSAGFGSVTPGTGLWSFWIVSETAAGTRSAPVGPQTITV